MGRLKNDEMASVPRQFEQYSLTLAKQINVLWKRSMYIEIRDQIADGDNVTLTKSTLRKSALVLLNAMPYIMAGLDKRLRNNLITNGFNGVSSDADRVEFEWVLNKELTCKLSPSKAASADVHFSNLLAMHTGNIYHRTRPKGHLKFRVFSPVLARQVADLNGRSHFQDGKPHTLSPIRLRKSLLSLLEMLPIILNKLPKEAANRLCQRGLDYLDSNKANYRLFEYIGVHESMQIEKLPTRFDDALANLRTMHFNKDCLPFSHLRLKTQTIDISRAMTLSYHEFSSLKDLLEEVGSWYENDSTKTNDSIADSINTSLNHIHKLLENELKGLDMHLAVKDRLLKHQSLVEGYISNLPRKPHRLNAFLKRIGPSEYGTPKIIPLSRNDDFFNYLQSISSTFAEEYKKYLDRSEEPSYQRVSFEKSFGKYLFVNQKDKTFFEVISILKKRGIRGLADNDGYGFSLLSEHINLNTNHRKTLKNTPLNSALDIYNWVNDSNTRLSDFSSSSISFENENDGTVQSINFEFLTEHYPQVFADFARYAEVNKARTDGGAIQQVTVRTHLNLALAVFKKYHSTLNVTDISSLNKQGLGALGNNFCQLLKHFRQQIQNDAKKSELKVGYAISLQNGLNELASFVGVAKSNTYKVSQSKEKRLAERNSKRNLYSFQQVVQIAYVVEKSLKRTDLTELQKLCLHAARIFIKTGWNLTPTLELNNDDIFYFDAPFQGNKTAAVRLFKRRADYQTKWANFAPETKAQSASADIALPELEYGQATSAVIANLEAIRDMTKGIANQHPLPNLRKRIFAYSDRSKVKILSVSAFTSCINILLKKEGIEESFSVRKIRKQGMNYTYRKVAKNFEKYSKAGMHTPQAFYEYYLKVDGVEVEQTVSNATEVMGDFLIRGVDDDIIFVEKAPINSKQTPSGRCVQDPTSDVVIDFKARNRKSLNEDEITACADFGACLICKYFRCIADAEGVWRLLSFEEVVIGQMVSASFSIGGDDGSDQQLNINKLKLRVSNLLVSLSKKNKGAIADGRKLFEEHGVHPDWEVA